jgi:hypothetical protein
MNRRLLTWQRLALAGSCLAAVLLSGCVADEAPPRQPQGQTTAAPTPSPTSTATAAASGGQVDGACRGAGHPATGVFRETSPRELDAFERWLGCRVDYAVDFSARDTWADIEQPTYLLKAWARQPRRLVLGVAMLPNQPEESIEKGAHGDYDAHYKRLAQQLVAGGQGNAILRVGWEFNLPESRWFTKDYNAFSTYWRRIVESMRAQPGSDFQFDWNVNNGAGAVDATNYYPGDDVVDYVGVDAYDVTSKVYPYPNPCDLGCRAAVQDRAWTVAVFGGTRSLSFWAGFTRQHHKPLSLPEWGLWNSLDRMGGADDPTYIRRMHDFIVDPKNGVAYQAYFEYDGGDTQHRLATFPEAQDLFRRLFNGS